MAIKSSQQLGLSGIDNTLLKTQGRRAVGGTITESGGYVIHTFTGSGQFTVLDQKLNLEYLIVGGGGGGGGAFNKDAAGGGGGAGAYIHNSTTVNVGNYTVTIGNGGTGGLGTPDNRGTVGGDTSIFSIISNGGAGAGTYAGASPNIMAGTSNGNASGSGAAGAGTNPANGGAGGQFGNGGGLHTGTGQSNVSTSCGGGGGAGFAGGNGVANSTGGNGGDGLQNSISGTATYYAGGGAGGSSNGSAGGGGNGGGGSRGTPTGSTGGNPGGNGTSNTGGGGGGASAGTVSGAGGNGGSGIIIVRYKKDNTPNQILKPTTSGLILDLDTTNNYSIPFSIECLIIAGGGGGGTTGANYCGGGGAGGVIQKTINTLVIGAYTVTVGAAGAAASNGGDSIFETITATGGGAGSSSYATAGNNGGSGGGGAPINAIGGTGIYGQGFKGGWSSSANQGGGDSGAGAGGGAGGPGGNLDSFPFTNSSSQGGAGIQSSITGTATWYAAGGNGSGYYWSESSNGIGGGTPGALGTPSRTTGATNTGSGGGGGRSSVGNAGGSGVVIIRYKGSQKATGGTITSSNGYTIHTFTGSGTFTVTAYMINDMSGNNYDGTLTNGAFYDSSNGGSIYLDGTNDYISVPTAAGRLNNSDFTISFWWKSNGAQTNYATIIGQGFTSGANNGAWAFKVQGGSSIVNFSYMYNSISDNTTSANPNDGTWHNVAAIRSGSTVTLYMDTTSIGSFTLNSYFVFGTSDTVYIGYNPRDAAYAKGWVANVQIYNRAMSTSELLQNYNIKKIKYGI
jgi:hypothetical protein